MRKFSFQLLILDRTRNNERKQNARKQGYEYQREEHNSYLENFRHEIRNKNMYTETLFGRVTHQFE